MRICDGAARVADRGSHWHVGRGLYGIGLAIERGLSRGGIVVVVELICLPR